jgi:hypothetical protein
MPDTHWIYEAEVPGTLDLAERARAGVNALLGVVDRSRGFQPHQCMRPYRNPPVLSPEPGGYVFAAGNEMWGKHAEALTEMRLASGSSQEPAVDLQTIRGMVSCIAEDGLFYSRPQRVEGDTLVDAEEFSDLLGGARVLLGLLARFQADGDAEWKRHAGRLARGFADVAVHTDGYAYFPDGHVGGAISRPRSGWKEPREPLGTSLAQSRDWYECASNVLFSHGGIVQALCAWHRASGEPEPRELAGEIVRFMLQERFWRPEAAASAVVPSEHAQFEGHIHGTARGLWGMLEYALLANDEKLKCFVRDGYEYIRTFGIARIGLFGEGCTVGDMTSLAVKLSDAGVGDYWEDADQYVRNHLSELQILDPRRLRDIAESSPATAVKPWEDPQGFYERTTGALCDDALHPTLTTPGLMMCCTYNGLIGLYHAWESIIRCRAGAAEVNLLLNRASPWLDVESHLPYEGLVVIRDKSARTIAVRVPRWADIASVRATVDGRAASPCWIGRRLVVDGLAPGAVLRVELPVVECTASYTVGWSGIQVPGWTEVTRLLEMKKRPGPVDYQVSEGHSSGAARPVFTIRFRGNDVADITPREEGPGIPLYGRHRFPAGPAPVRTVTRVVTSRVIEL